MDSAQQIYVTNQTPLSQTFGASLTPSVFLRTLFSNTLNLCSSLKVKDQYSQPYHWLCICFTCTNFQFLFSSDIRSGGSIAIVKKFDFDFFMVLGSISLPHPNKVFQNKCFCVYVCVCVCVCVCVYVCLSVAEGKAKTNRPISFKIDIQGPLANISSLFIFSFSP